MFNLFLAIFWLCLGALLVYARITGLKVFRIDESGVDMLAGLAFLLAVYNLVRWWAVRVSARARAQRWRAEQRRRENDKPPAEYDPTFDFTGREPPEPPKP